MGKETEPQGPQSTGPIPTEDRQKVEDEAALSALEPKGP